MKKRMILLITTIILTTMLVGVVPVANAVDINTTNGVAVATSSNAANQKITINLKKGKTKKVPVGTSFKIKIKNAVGKTTYKVSNKKFKVNKNGELKARKPGKATITIKTNGITIKRKIKATLKLKITYTPDEKVKINVGQSKKIKKIYKYTTNLDTLKKYVSAKKYKKFKKQVNKKAKHPKAKIKDTKIAKVANKSIKGKNKGKTKVVVSCGKQKFDVDVDVNKPTEVVFKDQNSKVAYSVEEAYQLIKYNFINYSIKGEKVEYPYIVLGFDKSKEKLKEALYDKIENDIDSPDNFHSLKNQLCADYEILENNGTKYIDSEFYNQSERAELKKLYNTTQDIFNSLNIDSFDEDYEKLVVLSYWMKTTCKGNTLSKFFGETFGSVKSVLYNHEGFCSDFAVATNYFCSLLKIPCVNNISMTINDHEWNYVKLGDKWYHYEPKACKLFLGDKQISEISNTATAYKLGKIYYETWEKRISDESIVLYQSELKEIAEKCGITADANGHKIWKIGYDNIIDDLT